MASAQMIDTPDTRALFGPVLAQHGFTFDAFVPVHNLNTHRANVARYAVVGMLDAEGWKTSRIAASLGLDPSTVRRILRNRPSGRPRPAAPAPRRLPIAPTPVEGDRMSGAPGSRHDCVHDAECLRALLRSYPPHDPPRHASCPTRCTRHTSPDKDTARYDASRAGLWGQRR